MAVWKKRAGITNSVYSKSWILLTAHFGPVFILPSQWIISAVVEKNIFDTSNIICWLFFLRRNSCCVLWRFQRPGSSWQMPWQGGTQRGWRWRQTSRWAEPSSSRPESEQLGALCSALKRDNTAEKSARECRLSSSRKGKSCYPVLMICCCLIIFS